MTQKKQRERAGCAWRPAHATLTTRWTKDVDPAAVLPEYPRPQFVRKEWISLNGLWDYAVRPRDAAQPTEYDGQILVPFCIESPLSGVGRAVTPDERLWYRRRWSVSPGWRDRRIVLHFGAVDWEAEAWLNGRSLGVHRGGYDGFSFDVTDALTDDEEQELVVAVWDPTDSQSQSWGKQHLKPNGVWYTAVTGIWRTVWAEPAPAARLEGLRLAPDVENERVRVTFDESSLSDEHVIEVAVFDDGQLVNKTAGRGAIDVAVPKPKLWSPENPFLYEVLITLRSSGYVGAIEDQAQSYFGMRSISVGDDGQGRTVLLLNGEPCFMTAPLDQGFWPDGIYTAPTDEALRSDIELTKRLGFNATRKHVKVEPERWYYWCDKLGLLVWQDFVSGGDLTGVCAPDAAHAPETKAQFELETERVVEQLRNHPSIVVWVVFNEGWGQYDTARNAARVRRLDPTRLVNSASGWNDFGVGDMIDAHSYPNPASPTVEYGRAAVLGEFGGLALSVPDHAWLKDGEWGYQTVTDSAGLTEAYCELLRRTRVLAGALGLSAAVYTQITDVETEINGLVTYDRELIKVDVDAVRRVNQSPASPPQTSVVVASDASSSDVRQTKVEPPADWTQAGFDDSGWSAAPTSDAAPAPWRGRESSARWARWSAVSPRAMRAPHLLVEGEGKLTTYVNGAQREQGSHFLPSKRVVPLTTEECAPGATLTIALHITHDQDRQRVSFAIIDVIDG